MRHLKGGGGGTGRGDGVGEGGVRGLGFDGPIGAYEKG